MSGGHSPARSKVRIRGTCKPRLEGVEGARLSTLRPLTEQPLDKARTLSFKGTGSEKQGQRNRGWAGAASPRPRGRDGQVAAGTPDSHPENTSSGRGSCLRTCGPVTSCRTVTLPAPSRPAQGRHPHPAGASARGRQTSGSTAGCSQPRRPRKGTGWFTVYTQRPPAAGSDRRDRRTALV